MCPRFSSFKPRQRVYRQAFEQLQALGTIVSSLIDEISLIGYISTGGYVGYSDLTKLDPDFFMYFVLYILVKKKGERWF